MLKQLKSFEIDTAELEGDHLEVIVTTHGGFEACNKMISKYARLIITLRSIFLIHHYYAIA